MISGFHVGVLLRRQRLCAASLRCLTIRDFRVGILTGTILFKDTWIRGTWMTPMMFRVVSQNFRSVLMSLKSGNTIFSAGNFRGTNNFNLDPTIMVSLGIRGKMRTWVSASIRPKSPNGLYNEEVLGVVNNMLMNVKFSMNNPSFYGTKNTRGVSSIKKFLTLRNSDLMGVPQRSFVYRYNGGLRALMTNDQVCMSRVKNSNVRE